jgi:hypothetical protein
VAAAAPGSGVPTGPVTFSEGSTTLGMATLTNGVATFSISSLALGGHSVTADYSGDTDFTGSDSVVLTQSVISPSTTEVAPSTTTATVGESITLTATVVVPPGTGTPTGTITFVDVNSGTQTAGASVMTNAVSAGSVTAPAGTVLGTAPLDANGHATLVVSSLPAGTNVIYAEYSGDATHAASVSEVAVVKVTGVPAVTVVSRYGFHDQPTYVVIDFSGALDPASAEDAANYVIMGPGYGPGRPRQRIKVRSAVYDPTSDSVTLRPVERLDVHWKYRLIVKGSSPAGLSSTTGVPLDGTSGSNYVTSLTVRNLAGRASQVPTASLLQEDAAAASRHAQAVSHTAVDHLLSKGLRLKSGRGGNLQKSRSRSGR